MKQSVLIVFCIFLIGACSAYNRIQNSDQNGLKTMRLVQPLQAIFSTTDKELKSSSALKANTVYLYEEKSGERPVVALNLTIEKLLTDSLVFISLDGENVQLSVLDGRSIIAENLWVPIIHSQQIQYKLNTDHDTLVLRLNEQQKEQLVEFFKKAVKQRDEIFPAIPPGQKKW